VTIAKLIVAPAQEPLPMRVCRECGESKPLHAFHRQSNAPLGRRARCGACATKRVASYRSRAEGSAFEERACEHCRQPFHFYRSLERSRPNQGRFCSTACKYAAGRVAVKCHTCGTEFQTWRSVRRRFCGPQCAGTIRRSDAGLSPLHVYAKKAWRDLRASIIERDGGQCSRCLSPFQLVVHHIEPFRVSANNDPENLITVCRSCHAAIHKAAASSSYVPVFAIGGVPSRSRN
jgi:5-methylcytosine-specific restriction endonuclease McrA